MTAIYQCELKELAAGPVLAIRARTKVEDLSNVLGPALGEIMQYLGGMGEYPAGPPYVAYFNMDMQDLDIEIGFPVARPLPGQGRVTAGQLPNGKAASCLHTGPYNEVSKAYEALGGWMAGQGLVPAGVAYEFYLNDPSVTAPQDLQTEIIFPLR